MSANCPACFSHQAASDQKRHALVLAFVLGERKTRGRRAREVQNGDDVERFVIDQDDEGVVPAGDDRRDDSPVQARCGHAERED